MACWKKPPTVILSKVGTTFLLHALPSLPTPKKKFLLNRDSLSALSPTSESNFVGKWLVHNNNKTNNNNNNNKNYNSLLYCQVLIRKQVKKTIGKKINYLFSFPFSFKADSDEQDSARPPKKKRNRGPKPRVMYEGGEC